MSHEIESQKLSFINQNSMSVTFSSTFSTIPTVVVTGHDNVNFYTSGITATGCTVHCSANITATVNIHIISYNP